MTLNPTAVAIFWAVLTVQVVTFLVLGFLFGVIGNWRFAVAQALLAVVQLVIYSGGIRA